MITIIKSTRDPDLYATISPTKASEVYVRFCRSVGWRGVDTPRPTRLLGELTVDAPFHLVADRVSTLLESMA